MIYPGTASPNEHCRPTRLAPHERMRIRAAAFRAKQLYPGPVGELVCRELLAAEDFGYLGTNAASQALADFVLKVEIP